MSDPRSRIVFLPIFPTHAFLRSVDSLFSDQNDDDDDDDDDDDGWGDND
jgi:hypothetical protein